jgi:hypothetical protein
MGAAGVNPPSGTTYTLDPPQPHLVPDGAVERDVAQGRDHAVEEAQARVRRGGAGGRGQNRAQRRRGQPPLDAGAAHSRLRARRQGVRPPTQLRECALRFGVFARGALERTAVLCIAAPAYGQHLWSFRKHLLVLGDSPK